MYRNVKPNLALGRHDRRILEAVYACSRMR